MRRAGFKRETTEKLIRRAAVHMIAQHGFRAASLRKVADEVGIQAGSLYNYIKSKDDFLFNLLKEHLELMLEDLERANAKSSNVVERLKKLIELHIRFHTEQKEEVIIGHLELRSLPPKNRKIITDLRDRYSNILTELIREGVKKKIFAADDPRVASFAILSMLSGVANWYEEGGRLSQAKIIDLHLRMTFRLLGMEEVPTDRSDAAPGRLARMKSEVT
jgi:AcrR family transcriptional regulator